MQYTFKVLDTVLGTKSVLSNNRDHFYCNNSNFEDVEKTLTHLNYFY